MDYPITKEQKEFIEWLLAQASVKHSPLYNKIWNFKGHTHNYALAHFVVKVKNGMITKYNDDERDLINKFITDNRKEIEEEWKIKEAWDTLYD